MAKNAGIKAPVASAGSSGGAKSERFSERVGIDLEALKRGEIIYKDVKQDGRKTKR